MLTLISVWGIIGVFTTFFAYVTYRRGQGEFEPLEILVALSITLLWPLWWGYFAYFHIRNFILDYVTSWYHG